MKILIGGASGLVGTALTQELKRAGHLVTPLVRGAGGKADGISWDPECGVLAPEQIEGFDAFVNLSGENVAGGRWTAARKKKIRDSRVSATKLLTDTAQRLSRPPKVIVNASAIGFYGDRGEEIVTEESPIGTGFLPETCAAWEAASRISGREIRVVSIRTGIVLAREGGALRKMLLPFKLGLGGVIGSGRQYMSWIHIADLVGIYKWAIENPSVEGVFNGVAPTPVTNREFTVAMGEALHRPTVFPLPAAVVKLLFGEMGEALLLEGARVVPKRLGEAGFEFKYPNIRAALGDLV